MVARGIPTITIVVATVVIIIIINSTGITKIRLRNRFLKLTILPRVSQIRHWFAILQSVPPMFHIQMAKNCVIRTIAIIVMSATVVWSKEVTMICFVSVSTPTIHSVTHPTLHSCSKLSYSAFTITNTTIISYHSMTRIVAFVNIYITKCYFLRIISWTRIITSINKWTIHRNCFPFPSGIFYINIIYHCSSTGSWFPRWNYNTMRSRFWMIL